MSRPKMTEEQKQHARIVRYRQNDIDRLDRTVAQLRSEQRKYQGHFALRLKWWIKLQADGQAPSLQWLIEHDVKFLQTVDEFSW